MAKHGKKYRAIAEKVAPKVYELEEALGFLKANTLAKFDETAELAFRLGLDPKKTDQTVRGTVSLPHGSGKKVRVLVEAREARTVETWTDRFLSILREETAG